MSNLESFLKIGIILANFNINISLLLFPLLTIIIVIIIIIIIIITIIIIIITIIIIILIIIIIITVELRFNEVAGDRPNLFVKSSVRYIENLDITNLRGNDQTVRYIEVIVNDWVVTQVTSVTYFNAVFVTQKCRVFRCNSFKHGFQ